MKSLIYKIRRRLYIKRWLANQNTIGRNVRIGEKTTIVGCNIGNDIEIGHHCKLKQVDISGCNKNRELHFTMGTQYRFVQCRKWHKDWKFLLYCPQC
jgi:acetyltransferase-like isoleucine patch superfamily enzyme